MRTVTWHNGFMSEDPNALIDLVCRKSRASASKRGKREISVSAQEARGRRVAAEMGLTVRQVWEEVGSASRFRRSTKTPKQELALSALERHEVGALWVFRLDRWTRRGAGAVLRIVEPPDGQPRRLLVDNGDPDNPGIGLDSANPRDRSELIRRAEDAREETEVLSERVRNTKAYQRDNGEWVNATAPYGLRVVLVAVPDEDGDEVDERKLELDPSSADQKGNPSRSRSSVARQITYEWPVEGRSYRWMCNQLNTSDVPSPSGGSWTIGTVRDMVQNPVYAGWQATGRQDGRSRRILYRNAAGERVSVMIGSPLLTDDEQRTAQRCMRGEAQPGAENHYKAKHLLTDLLNCEGCNGSMSAGGGGYSCWRGQQGGDCPRPAFVAFKAADEYVHHRWSYRLAASEPTDPLLRHVARRWALHEDPQTTADQDAAREALGHAEADLSRLWTDRRSGLYDGPSDRFFAPALAEANEAVVKAQAALQQTRGKRRVDITFLLEPDMQQQAWEAADATLRRALLRLAINRIVVSKAPYRGAPFNGTARMAIKWVDD